MEMNGWFRRNGMRMERKISTVAYEEMEGRLKDGDTDTSEIEQEKIRRKKT